MLRERPPCPPPDEFSTLVLVYLGPLAEQCFGHTSLTVRGWVPVIDGLVGECCVPVREPSWLAYPGGYLMPGAGEYFGGWGVLNLYIPPGVNAGLLRQGTWVEVVGHYRDDAAGTCRSIPLAMLASQSLESQVAVRRDCQQRFVVESISAVDGP